jgi:hypothetical protein
MGEFSDLSINPTNLSVITDKISNLTNEHANNSSKVLLQPDGERIRKCNVGNVLVFFIEGVKWTQTRYPKLYKYLGVFLLIV